MRPTLRISILTALFFTAYSGVVLASSTACQVAAIEQLRTVQNAVHKHVHHSGATLARWKIGAAAWSKAHGGKVYAGVPVKRQSDWTPLRFTCDDVALDLSRPDQRLMLASVTSPEPAMYEARTPPDGGLDPAAAKPLAAEDSWQQAMAEPLVPVPLGGASGVGAGGGLNGSVGPESFPPGAVPPTLAGPVPAPESPTIVLLGMGSLSFLVSKLRRRTVV